MMLLLREGQFNDFYEMRPKSCDMASYVSSISAPIEKGACGFSTPHIGLAFVNFL